MIPLFKIWVFGGIDEGEEPFMEPVSKLEWDFGQLKAWWTNHNEFSWVGHECILLQAVGALDMNDEEIFDGDILHGPEEDFEMFRIYYDEEGCCWAAEEESGCYWSLGDLDTTVLKKVGNINSDPDWKNLKEKFEHS